MEKKRLCFIGAGGLAQIVFDGYMNGLLSDYEIIGVTDRHPENMKLAEEKTGAEIYDSVEQLIALKPEMKDDDITIKVHAEDAECTLHFHSKPADVAGWSIISLLRNLSAPIQFM